MTRLDPEIPLSRGVRVSMQCLAVAIPLLLLVHGPARAASVCEPTRTSVLDGRLAAKTDEGVVPLRRFVERTRMIFQLDMQEALQRVERHRQAASACAAVVAAR